jgi:hypothetical protein
MTILKHIYALKNVMSQGPVSDDFTFNDRLIAHMLVIARATILKRELNKRNNISEENYTYICVEFEDGTITNCTIPDVVDVTKRIGIKDLPSIINTKWGSPVTLLTPDGCEVPKLNRTIAKYLSGSIDSDDTLGWYLFNSKPVLVNGDFIKSLTAQIIMEDPTEILDLTDDCTFDNVEFPLDATLTPAVYEMAIKLLMPYAFPVDTLNNASTQEINAQQNKV